MNTAQQKMWDKLKYDIRVDEDGTKQWYLNGVLHREDGPAVEHLDGTKFWYLNGITHREDGPAVERADGSKHWYSNGKLHREDGPAVEYSTGDKVWYLNDKRLTEEEFKLKMNKERSTKCNITNKRDR